MATTVHKIDADLRVWRAENGGITIHAVSPHGDPVELNADQARRLADLLNSLADRDEEA